MLGNICPERAEDKIAEGVHSNGGFVDRSTVDMHQIDFVKGEIPLPIAIALRERNSRVEVSVP